MLNQRNNYIRIQQYEDDSHLLPTFAFNQEDSIEVQQSRHILINSKFDVFSFSNEQIEFSSEEDSEPVSKLMFKNVPNTIKVISQLYAIINIQLLNVLRWAFKRINGSNRQCLVYKSIDLSNLAQQKIIPYLSSQLRSTDALDRSITSQKFLRKSLCNTLSPKRQKNIDNKRVFRFLLRIEKFKKLQQSRRAFERIQEYSSTGESRTLFHKTNGHQTSNKLSSKLQTRIICKYATKIIQYCMFSRLKSHVALSKAKHSLHKLSSLYHTRCVDAFRCIRKSGHLNTVLLTFSQLVDRRLYNQAFKYKLYSFYAIQAYKKSHTNYASALNKVINLVERNMLKNVYSSFFRIRLAKQPHRALKDFLKKFTHIVDTKIHFDDNSTVDDNSFAESQPSLEIGPAINPIFHFEDPIKKGRMVQEMASAPMKSVSCDDILESVNINLSRLDMMFSRNFIF